MRDIKEKPAERVPKSNAARELPKEALKKAWKEAKEKSRTKLRESTATQGDSDYTAAQDTGATLSDTSYSAIKQSTDFSIQRGRKFTRKQIEKYWERHAAERVETTRTHAAIERGVGPKQAGRGMLSDTEQRPRRGTDLPRQRTKEKVVTAKTAPRDIRGVTQGQRQLRTAANEIAQNKTAPSQVQTRTRQVQLVIQKAASSTRKTITAACSAIRHFLASLHSLVTAIAAGVSVALSIIIVISLVAFVSGSAYGIFFAANAPNENAISVQEAVETLTEEYRDRLEEISNTIQHDRQDIVANDDAYFIQRSHPPLLQDSCRGASANAPMLVMPENLSRLREKNCITASQYWERRNPLEHELTDVKNTISKAAINHPLLRTIAQTKQLAEHYTYLKPLAEFDEHEFKFAVSRVLVDSESCTFELKNGMKCKEIF